jgi:hypothetical protein
MKNFTISRKFDDNFSLLTPDLRVSLPISRVYLLQLGPASPTQVLTVKVPSEMQWMSFEKFIPPAEFEPSA